MLHVVEHTGEVVHAGHSRPDTVPSRREVEQAFIRLRAKHGSTSGHDIEILWRAIARVLPLHPNHEEKQHDQ